MSGMWSRWAQRQRLIGIILLGAAAVAIAVAVLLWLIGAGWTVIFPAILALGFLIVAGEQLAVGHRYAKLARR